MDATAAACASASTRCRRASTLTLPVAILFTSATWRRVHGVLRRPAQERARADLGLHRCRWRGPTRRPLSALFAEPFRGMTCTVEARSAQAHLRRSPAPPAARTVYQFPAVPAGKNLGDFRRALFADQRSPDSAAAARGCISPRAPQVEAAGRSTQFAEKLRARASCCRARPTFRRPCRSRKATSSATSISRGVIFPTSTSPRSALRSAAPRPAEVLLRRAAPSRRGACASIIPANAYMEKLRARPALRRRHAGRAARATVRRAR